MWYKLEVSKLESIKSIYYCMVGYPFPSMAICKGRYTILLTGAFALVSLYWADLSYTFCEITKPDQQFEQGHYAYILGYDDLWHFVNTTLDGFWIFYSTQFCSQILYQTVGHSFQEFLNGATQ